jgi:hypothetical protein
MHSVMIDAFVGDKDEITEDSSYTPVGYGVCGKQRLRFPFQDGSSSSELRSAA